jgi:hypothetical protein
LALHLAFLGVLTPVDRRRVPTGVGSAVPLTVAATIALLTPVIAAASAVFANATAGSSGEKKVTCEVCEVTLPGKIRGNCPAGR